jgi:hypothetical protein
MSGLAPEGFMSLRDALSALAEILYAHLPPHTAVIKAREAGVQAKFTIDQMEETARLFWQKVDAEHAGRAWSRPVQIFAGLPASKAPVPVPPDWLEGIPKVRTYVGADLHLLRPLHRLARELARHLGGPIAGVQLLIKREDFERLSRNIRRTRKRKANNPHAGGPPGRPSSRHAIKEAIIKLVEAGKWQDADPLKKLENLVRREIDASPSSVRRALRELAEETGDLRYQSLRKAARYSKAAEQSTIHSGRSASENLHRRSKTVS